MSDTQHRGILYVSPDRDAMINGLLEHNDRLVIALERIRKRVTLGGYSGVKDEVRAIADEALGSTEIR